MSSKVRRRAHLAVSALVATLALAAFTSSAAAGWVVYGGDWYPPDTWTSDGAIRWYTYNQASNLESGTVRVGTRMIRDSDGAVLYRYFGYNVVSSGTVPGNWRRADAANAGSGWNRIGGYAEFS